MKNVSKNRISVADAVISDTDSLNWNFKEMAFHVHRLSSIKFRTRVPLESDFSIELDVSSISNKQGCKCRHVAAFYRSSNVQYRFAFVSCGSEIESLSRCLLVGMYDSFGFESLYQHATTRILPTSARVVCSCALKFMHGSREGGLHLGEHGYAGTPAIFFFFILNYRF